ncbi:MAG: NUDIX hydrolase [Bacteroidota bacterium]
MPSNSNSKNPWKTLQVTEVYDNPWIQVTHRDVLNPAGNEGIYGLVHFKNIAIGIVPLDEQYNTWLVGQYRYTLDRYTWEIPEGGGPIGEAPIDSAKRELLEETGIQAQRWTQILDLHTSNSVTDEYGLAYVAQDLSYGTAMPEETEELTIRQLPFAEAFQMVMDGQITDSLAMVAIMKTHYLLERGQL